MILAIVATLILAMAPSPPADGMKGAESDVLNRQAITMMTPQRDNWSAGFLESEDAESIISWAQEMCRGLQLAPTAKELGVAPTIKAVAHVIVGNVSDDKEIQHSATMACEDELRRATRR
jgi:hypothetical protein